MSHRPPLGRLILPALRWRAETGFAHEAAAIDDALDFGAGGFILFGGTRESVRALTADLMRRAGRPLLIASDLERGAGQQVEDLTSLPPPLALAALNDVAAVHAAAQLTAREALSVGINWVLAPVADLDAEPANPIVQTRAFGSDPRMVGRMVRAWIQGCQSAGALACAKHYPGHGRTREDSHDALAVVDTPAIVLEDEDELPFRAAVHAGVASVMTAHVRYPALDPAPVAATFSRPILDRLRRLGFRDLVVTDALIMEGARAAGGSGAAAVAAIAAGCDLLLYPGEPRAVWQALETALAAGQLEERRVMEALARYDRAISRIASLPLGVASADPALDAAVADDLASRVLRASRGRGDPHAWRPRLPLEVVVIDDDLGGPYPPGPDDVLATRLAEQGLAVGQGGDRVVAVFAEPRAWKGRAELGDASRRALAGHVPGASLVVLFAHPRLVAEIPGEVPVLVAWHRQPLMQDAVARWIATRVSL
ncbi:MAG: glycoside hydrolase family 3 N-terminal domain-containing protein [Gemmatimonadota bacterium]